MDHFFTSSIFYFVSRSTQLSCFSDYKSCSFICTTAENAVFHCFPYYCYYYYYYYYYYYHFLYSRVHLVSSQPSWVTLTMKKRRSTKHDGYLSIVIIIIINSSYINGSHLPKKFIQSIVWTNMYKDLYHFLVVFLGIFFDFSIMGKFFD